MKPAPLFAILMLIALFLPWIDLGLAGVSGFDMLRGIFEADDASGGMVMDPDQMGDDAWLLYTFFVIPVGAVITLVVGFGSDAAGRFFGLITGLAPWVIAVYAFMQLSGQEGAGQVFDFLGIGAYATLVVGLLLILTGFGAFRTRRG